MLKKLIALLILALSFPVLAAESAKEYEIKAAFLVNLLSFVKWPESAQKDEDLPFRLCIIGADPFGELLDVAAEERTKSKRPIKIERLEDTAGVGACEAIFIGESEHSRVRSVIAKLSTRAVLTVGDTDNFINHGGMIQFFKRANKVRLMLAPNHLTSVGLKPDAQLMRVSVLVKGNK